VTLPLTDPRGGDLPGARVHPSGLLQVAGQPNLRPGLVRRPPGRRGAGIHADDPPFGYRFITDELASEHGITAGENRVQRLCSAHGIFSVLARRKGRRPRPGEPVHDDLVRRSFGAKAPNELWFTDITEHPTDEGKLYLCAIKDAFSGRIVGYSTDRRMKAHLAWRRFEMPSDSGDR